MSHLQNSPRRKISSKLWERKRARMACVRCRKLHKRCSSESIAVRCVPCIKADKDCNYAPARNPSLRRPVPVTRFSRMGATVRAHTIESQPSPDSGIHQSSHRSVKTNQNSIARISSHRAFSLMANRQIKPTQVYPPCPPPVPSSSPFLASEIYSDCLDSSYNFGFHGASSSHQEHSVEPSDTSRPTYYDYLRQLNTPSTSVNDALPPPPHLSHISSLASPLTTGTYLAPGYEPLNIQGPNGHRDQTGDDISVLITTPTDCRQCQITTWCPDHPNQIFGSW